MLFHLRSKNNNHYIVEIDDTLTIGREMYLSGYIIDSNNSLLPMGNVLVFSIYRNDSNIIESTRYMCDYEIIEYLGEWKFPNIFEKVWLEIKKLKFNIGHLSWFNG